MFEIYFLYFCIGTLWKQLTDQGMSVMFSLLLLVRTSQTTISDLQLLMLTLTLTRMLPVCYLLFLSCHQPGLCETLLTGEAVQRVKDSPVCFSAQLFSVFQSKSPPGKRRVIKEVPQSAGILSKPQTPPTH